MVAGGAFCSWTSGFAQPLKLANNIKQPQGLQRMVKG